MAKAPQLTQQTLKVIAAAYYEPDSSGSDICKATSLPSGTVYPILSRLEQAGWLKSQWERGDPSHLGRPRRRFYRLTAEGVRVGRETAVELTKVAARFAI